MVFPLTGHPPHIALSRHREEVLQQLLKADWPTLWKKLTARKADQVSPNLTKHEIRTRSECPRYTGPLSGKPMQCTGV